ncbi:hypothetical protein NC651_016716 [Populus alba x Populus x berolinensis]|nr:hypothetical protein NC651_016716 [Populus alba x Populus x berolinensis]
MGCDVSISQGQKWSLLARIDLSKWRSLLRATWKKVGFLLEFANPHQPLLGFLHFLFFRATIGSQADMLENFFLCFCVRKMCITKRYT